MSSNSSPRNIKWIEGIRGLTSCLVIVTHVARAWDFPLFWPTDNPGGTPRLLQYPIMRIPFQGRIGVPMFAFLTGFVCAYKPLKLAYHQSNAPAALHSVARSAFRRSPRLVFPAMIATLISFTLTCLGAYTTASRCDSYWVRFDAPKPVPTLGDEVRRLFHTILTTWTNTENVYDRHQWAMRPLLIGAFQVYIVLAATIGMRFTYRVVVHVLLMLYWLMNPAPLTETFGANLALGTLLAELSLHRPTQNFIARHSRVLVFVVTPTLVFAALCLGSYPHEHETWANWSRTLYRTFVDPAGDHSRGTFLVPLGSDAPRRMSSVMIQLLAVSVFLNPVLREMLSHRWLLWLGRHSFAVYLVHGTILRTVGMWISYGISGQPWNPEPVFNQDGSPREPDWIPIKSWWHVRVAAVLFVVFTYIAAWAWMRWVDSACARATEWLEKRVFDEANEESDGYGARQENGYTYGNGNGYAKLENGRPDALPYMNGHGLGYDSKHSLSLNLSNSFTNGSLHGFLKESPGLGGSRSSDEGRTQLSP